MRIYLVILVLLNILIVPLASAQRQHPPQTPPQVQSGWSWSGFVEQVTLDEVVAAREGVDNTASAIGFAGERYTSDTNMTLSLGMSLLLYDDNNEFIQYVHDNWGDSRYEESSASAVMVFADYGPKLRFGIDNRNFVMVRGGASRIFGSERSIGFCSNCYTEEIDVDGGAYGVLGLGRTLGNFDISLQFQQYFTGDLDNTLRLKISGAF